ncbi:hypothetical protein [Saccharothrix deserti]|uniref:hypothetical protein n=1 Tax=Saccharothrix deserti TaxID=2593674 RepID=UPI00131BF29F|nr:hypothetical protein [Saccharothrix deserti]
MAEPDAAGLLDELNSLRRRARIARHGYWLPSVVIGLLTLGAIPFYRPVDESCPPGVRSCSLPYRGTGFDVPGLGKVDLLRVFNSGNLFPLASPLALGLYWVLVLLVGLGATVWWYRWRAVRAGVETSTGAYVRVTLGGLVVVLGIALVGGLMTEIAPYFHFGYEGNLLASAVFLALPVGLAILSDKEVTRTRWYRIALIVGFSLAVLLGAVVVNKTGGLMLFAAGLLVLAWLERSPLCAVVALGYTGFTLLANVSYMGTLYYRLGWRPDSRLDTVFSAKDVLLPGAIALVGGLVALVAGRVRR